VSAPWIAAIAALWLTVLVLTFTVIGIVRRVGTVLEGVEQRLSSAAELGAAVDSTISPFQVVDARGRAVVFEELVTQPTLLLVMSNHCSACEALATQLEGVGESVGGMPFVVVTNADPEVPYPATLPVLYDPDGAATKALDNRATPQAYVLDSTGLVLDRRVPGSPADLEEMARGRRHRAANGSGAPLGRRNAPAWR
jgi:thiol-disulfide isomerase/thioredoxin